MFENNTKKEICFFLPEDGEIGQETLLSQFDAPNLKMVYIKAYAFNWDDLLKKIQDVDNRGIPVYVLADSVQARGPSAWDKIVALNKTLKHGEILLTTAGVGSSSTGQIWHSKAITFIYNDNTEPVNWEGSVNFSSSGWNQGNTAQLFTSQEWSDNFVSHFTAHKQWTLEHAKNKQIAFILANPVKTEEVDINEDNAELFEKIYKLEQENKKSIIIGYIFATIIAVQWFIIGWLLLR